MAVDHIIPLATGGTSDIETLCLACYRCTEFKGTKISATDPVSGNVVSLFNPRRQLWDHHFAWSDDGSLIVGRTACGRATIDALRMNDDWLVQARRIWIVAGLHPPLE